MVEKIIVKTKHGELTLEQLAEVQPGIARLMKEIGERYHVLFYAAKGGNWKLAQHEVNVVSSLLRAGATLRPKYAKDLADFTLSHLQPISDSVSGKNWKSFEIAYKKGIEESNRFHEKYGYGFIRYALPKNPPEYFDLTYDE